MWEFSVHTDRATFALEVAVVSLVGLTLAVHTVQSWAPAARPFLWSAGTLVLFAAYRLVRYGSQDSPDAERGNEPLPDQEPKGGGSEAPSRPEGTESSDDVDELRVPAGDGYDAGESDETTAYLDWDEARKAGLVSGAGDSSTGPDDPPASEDGNEGSDSEE